MWHGCVSPVSMLEPLCLARLLRHHALKHSTYVLSCLDERTACISLFSSDVCAFL